MLMDGRKWEEASIQRNELLHLTKMLEAGQNLLPTINNTCFILFRASQKVSSSPLVSLHDLVN